MTTSKKLLRQSPSLFIGFALILIGLINNTVFIAIGATFIAIGAASTRHCKAEAQVSESEQ